MDLSNPPFLNALDKSMATAQLSLRVIQMPSSPHERECPFETELDQWASLQSFNTFDDFARGVGDQPQHIRRMYATAQHRYERKGSIHAHLGFGKRDWRSDLQLGNWTRLVYETPTFNLGHDCQLSP
jgi:hypothetical protein